MTQRPADDDRGWSVRRWSCGWTRRRYRPEVQFALPEQATAPAVPVNATLGADGVLTASLFDTDQSGFYRSAARAGRQFRGNAPLRDERRSRPRATWRRSTAQQLAPRLEGVKYHYEQAAAFQSTTGELAGYNLGEAILYLLVLLLIGEQILAWSASYHPRRRDVPQTQGGAA